MKASAKEQGLVPISRPSQMVLEGPNAANFEDMEESVKDLEYRIQKLEIKHNQID